MVFCEKLEKDIPKDWEYCSYTTLVALKGGGTPKTEIRDYWDGEYPFFTPADVGISTYTTQTQKTITKLGLKQSSTKLYAKDTVFITARGTVGAISMAATENGHESKLLCGTRKRKHFTTFHTSTYKAHT